MQQKISIRTGFIHKILAGFAGISQLNRSLIFQTLFGILLVVFRMIKSGEHTYVFMLWNLFLAGIPLFLSRLCRIEWIIRKAGIAIYGIVLLWLLFLPNAPYIVTDFIHLEEKDNIPLWYDLFLLTFFAMEGLMLGIVSVKDMEKTIARMHSVIAGKGFAMISLVLSSLGVYMGRFLRYNSWDIFFSPAEIIRNVGSRLLNPMDYPGLYGMIAILSVLLITLYSYFTRFEISVRRIPA